MASIEAFSMFMRWSISSLSTRAMAHAIACFMITVRSSIRRRSVSCLESLRSGCAKSSGKITAAANTGPARHPRRPRRIRPRGCGGAARGQRVMRVSHGLLHFLPDIDLRCRAAHVDVVVFGVCAYECHHCGVGVAAHIFYKTVVGEHHHVYSAPRYRGVEGLSVG